MGLDTTHNAWHGPYSFFNDWRKHLAKQIFIDLTEMEGFGGFAPWEPFEDHDLYPLLNHSDCDGVMTPDECKKTIRGLFQSLNLNEQSEWNEYTQQFIDGCKLAISKNENIEFR